MTTLQLTRTSAAFVTFLLSALCHELVMAVVTKKIRPYLFLMQMAQLPMIALGRLPIVRRNKTIGNIVFWIGLMAGFPLLWVTQSPASDWLVVAVDDADERDWPLMVVEFTGRSATLYGRCVLCVCVSVCISIQAMIMTCKFVWPDISDPNDADKIMLHYNCV